MSISRCGLQITRDFTITNDYHNHPRHKQIGCLISGVMVQDTPESKSMTKESMTTNDTINDQLEQEMDVEREEKKIKDLIIKEQEGGGVNVNYNMMGNGLFSKLSRIPRLFKSGVDSVSAKISNTFPNSDENARPLYPGEHHALFKLPSGKYGRANYAGPGTHIVERIKRNDPPRVPTDKVGQAHDIRYALAETDADVRNADVKFVRKLKQLKRTNKDRNVNIYPSMIGIRGKMAAENFSLLSRKAFIDDEKPKPADKVMLSKKIKQLEQEGFGQKGKGAMWKRSPRLHQNWQRPSQGRPLYFDRRVHRMSGSGPQGNIAGTTKTQSLGKIGSAVRGQVQVDRRSNRTLTSIIADSQDSSGRALKNTKAAFKNRNFQSVAQTGSGQHPTPHATAGSETIMGRGYPGSNIADPARDVHTGSGRKQKNKKYPGDELLKNIHGLLGKPKKKGKRRKKKYPMYMDEHNMSSFLANKMLPMVMAKG